MLNFRREPRAAFVTWELYGSLHNIIKKDEFEAAEAKAEFEVRQVIGPRWGTITPATYGFDVLQETICKVMDQQAENEKSGAGKGIASVSNDGYTETYTNAKATDAQQDLADQIKAWLSGTGLVGAY